MIKIKYVINGALFRLEWARADLASAPARIAALRANGIDVTVCGLKGRGRAQARAVAGVGDERQVMIAKANGRFIPCKDEEPINLEVGDEIELVPPAESSLADCIVALKREPNAAGQAHPSGIASSDSPLTRGDLQDATDLLSKPAPAAPDVASMVRCIDACAKFMEERGESPRAAADLRKAAALLAKLGQGGFTPDPTVELLVSELCKPDTNETKY